MNNNNNKNYLMGYNMNLPVCSCFIFAMRPCKNQYPSSI
uniref:Uncharacterized protein n=1 Tax=Anguilla anguilla TaxID=7936 RepID=A0A0E9RA64_ANGAN